MKYQKIINLLDNTPNKPTIFKTTNWVKINNESRRTYDYDNQATLRSEIKIPYLITPRNKETVLIKCGLIFSAAYNNVA